MELDSDSVVGQEHIETAVKFSVDLGTSTAPVQAKKYVLAFMQNLLLRREKLETGLVEDYIHSGVVHLWQEVLSTLETSDRKLLAIQSGSLIFTLFCPTISSALKVQEDYWIESLTSKMHNFARKIG